MTTIALIKHLILKAISPLERRGITITMRRKLLDARVVNLISEYRKHSLCPFAHFETAYRALAHINQNQIPGDIVICGVARGGMAKMLLDFAGFEHGTPRKVWCYDLFDGGSLPGKNDSEWERQHGEEIKRSMAVDERAVYEYVTDFSRKASPVRWIKGDILKTIPENMPSRVALLYLDTDYYDTTLHELVCLEPIVSKGGVIIQDDCGLCRGAEMAIKAYYLSLGSEPFRTFMSESGCCWQKP